MNLTNKLKQNFVINKIKETDWNTGNSSPLVVEFDPTAVCNLACPGCISEDIIAIGNSFSKERVIELGKEFIECGIKAVILIGGGEPLAHPKIGEFINLLGENDIQIGITTNGVFIDRYIEQIANFSSWTRVSMDAATTETFGVLRPSKGGKSTFDKVVSNMRLLAKIKKGKLGFSFLIQTEADGEGVINNINEIYDAALLAKGIGCDYFEVKPTYNFRDGVAHSLMKHKQQAMDAARFMIDKTAALEDENFKILEAINLQFSLEGVDKQQPKQYKNCPSTHLRTTITPGGAYVCPYWRGKNQMMIGDVNKNSVAEMWNGDLRKNVMKRLDPSKDCNFHCLRHETNIESFNLKEKIQNNEPIDVVDDFDRFL